MSSKRIETLIDQIISFNRWLSPPHEWLELVEEAVAIGEPAVLALLDALSAVKADQRSNVINVLSRIGSRRSVPALIKLLDDENDDVKLWILHALGMIGDPEAVSAMSLAFLDDNENVQIGAAVALRHIDHDDAVQVLITALDFGEKVQSYALASLEQIGERSVQPLVYYLDLLPDETLRRLIMGTLARIGTPEAKSAVERLSK